jgi:Calx-beta domain
MRPRVWGIAALAVGSMTLPHGIAGAVTVPTVRVRQQTVIESQGGKVAGLVPITLDTPSAAPVTLHYATANLAGDLAVPHSDYKPISGTLTFEPGQVEQTVKVPILPDHVQDPGKTFHVTIDSVVGATLSQADALVIIDDTYPAGGLIGSIAQIDSQAVGRGKPYTVKVTFALIDKFDQAVTGTYLTGPISAQPGIDYVLKTGSLTIPAGSLSATVSVKLIKRTATTYRTFEVLLSGITGLPNGETSATAYVDIVPQPA